MARTFVAKKTKSEPHLRRSSGELRLIRKEPLSPMRRVRVSVGTVHEDVYLRKLSGKEINVVVTSVADRLREQAAITDGCSDVESTIQFDDATVEVSSIDADGVNMTVMFSDGARSQITLPSELTVSTEPKHAEERKAALGTVNHFC